jgi:hypothetical protein
MQTIQPNRFLRGALLADAAVSGAVAALQLALTGALAELLQLPHLLLIGTGAFLAAYVALLIALALSTRVWAPLIWLVVVGNVAWALGCVGLLVNAQVTPSALGNAFVVVQVAAVLVFAALEYKGMVESLGMARAAVVQA